MPQSLSGRAPVLRSTKGRVRRHFAAGGGRDGGGQGGGVAQHAPARRLQGLLAGDHPVRGGFCPDSAGLWLHLDRHRRTVGHQSQRAGRGAARRPENRHAGRAAVPRRPGAQRPADRERAARGVPAGQRALRVRPHGDHRLGHAHPAHPAAGAAARAARSGAAADPRAAAGAAARRGARARAGAPGCPGGDRLQPQRARARCHAV